MQDALGSVTAAQADSAEGAAEHSEENEDDQSRNEREDEHDKQPGGSAEEFKCRLKLRVGISCSLLLNDVKKGCPDFASLMQDGYPQGRKGRGHAKAEESADGSQAGAGAGMDSDFGVAPPIQGYGEEACSECGNHRNDQLENHTERTDESGHGAWLGSLVPAHRNSDHRHRFGGRQCRRLRRRCG